MSAYDPKDPDGMRTKKILKQFEGPAGDFFRNLPQQNLDGSVTVPMKPSILSLSRGEDEEDYWLHVNAPNGLQAMLRLTSRGNIVNRALQSALEAQKP